MRINYKSTVMGLALAFLPFLQPAYGEEPIRKRMLLVGSFAAEKKFYNENAPAGKFLGSERELLAFWRLFKIEEKKPTVDFSKQLIFLTTTDDNVSNRMCQRVYLQEGDLRLRCNSPLRQIHVEGFRPSKDYRVRLLATSRAGVKTVGGVAIDRNPWPKIEDWDQPQGVIEEVVEQAAPEGPKSALRGLSFAYYEGSEKELQDLDGMTPIKTDVLTDSLLTSEIRERNKGYGIRFTGTIVVPQTGSYTFLHSFGRDLRLSIAGNTIIGEDGRLVNVKLPQGEHAFSFTYLNPTGQSRLALAWRGPGIDGVKSLVGQERTSEVEILTRHKTIAVFKGVEFTGTANLAFFKIRTYLDYQRRSAMGYDKYTDRAIQIGDSHGNPFSQLRALYHWGGRMCATPGQRAVVKSLKEGDVVLLGWNHEKRQLLREGGGGNYVPTLLRKVNLDEVNALTKKMELDKQAIERAKKSGEYYQPAAFARRLMKRYPLRFGKLVPEEFEKVSALDFKDLHVSEDDLISIGRLVFLQSLILYRCKLDGKHLKHLRNLQELRVLNLKFAIDASPDAALSHVGALKNLEKLNLCYVHMNEKGFAHLSNLKELSHLELNGGYVTDKGLVALVGCPKLEHLAFDSPFRLEGSGLAQLSKLKNLRFLSLIEGRSFSEELLPSLAKLTGLTELNLSSTKGFGAKNINMLTALKDLKKLNLLRPYHGEKPFKDQDVKVLKAALPECEISVGR